MNKPFYKLKRFYIPCGVLVALIIFTSLTYHFLHRPLDNAYLIALKNKDVLFGLQMQNNLDYFYLASNSTDLEEINNYLNVADDCLSL
ncbi:hypothetical protein [Campylobacter jejuni]|uniref:hypothetical protein n=1 Tax=Campylobacter jejuni TaxID=197 RepID=UPI00207BF84B|nr:hypothetical protein [Campylobacter jejuni]